MFDHPKPLAWILLAFLMAGALLGFGALLSRGQNEFHEACKPHGVVVKSATTNEMYCIDKSVVKSAKRI